MSGTAPVSPNTIDTTLIQDGQAPGSITANDIRVMEDSLSGMFPQTGFTTSQTLTAIQHGTVLPFTASSALTVTIPTNASVSMPVGVMFGVVLLAASTSTLQILGASGVTVNSASANPTTPYLRASSSFASLWQQAANVWYVWGDLL